MLISVVIVGRGKRGQQIGVSCRGEMSLKLGHPLRRRQSCIFLSGPSGPSGSDVVGPFRCGPVQSGTVTRRDCDRRADTSRRVTRPRRVTPESHASMAPWP